MEPLRYRIVDWLQNPRQALARARARWPQRDLVATLRNDGPEPLLELAPVEKESPCAS